MYVYIYMCIYTCICVYIYIYICVYTYIYIYKTAVRGVGHMGQGHFFKQRRTDAYSSRFTWGPRGREESLQPSNGCQDGFPRLFFGGPGVFFLCVGRRSGDFLIFDRCLRPFTCFCFVNLFRFGTLSTLLAHIAQQRNLETGATCF